MSERSGILSGEEVSRLVGIVYDCVLAPDRWTDAIDMIRTELDFATGMLSSVAPSTGDYLTGAVCGISAYWLARIEEVRDAVPDLWGGHERLAQLPLEEPIANSQACGTAHLKQNRFYQEWARPQGLIDLVAIALEKENGMLANVGFGRHKSAGPVDDAAMQGLRLLAPHLRRAVNISRILEAKRIEAASFAAVLEAHRAGVVLLDAAMRVVHANKAAAAMLSAGDPIQVRQGRLGVADSAAERALDSSVARCATDEALLGGRSGTGIALRRGDGEACIAHVLPLQRRSAVPDAVKQAVAALFVTHSSRPLASVPSQVLDTLYDMTPAETRVFDLIVEGCTQAEAAARLGVAVSTLKTHLLRVFEKTGTRRQADLTKLARSLAIPI